MVSQYTRDLIRREAEARALENSKPKVEEVKPSEKTEEAKPSEQVEVEKPIEKSVEKVEEKKPIVKENFTSGKKTDAEKLKRKKE